jgi:hypothetical protein
MDATRRRDGKRVMLKRLFPEEGPHELLIASMLSSPEVVQNPRNHCVPLLDIIEIPNSAQRLMVMPFLRPFNNPHFETYGEFVAFLTQICEVDLLGQPTWKSILISCGPGSPIHARAKYRS